MKQFTKELFTGNHKTTFTEHNAPNSLTGEKSVKGSTMDIRWFWEEHVLTLEVGQHVYTDFHKITRIN